MVINVTKQYVATKINIAIYIQNLGMKKDIEKINKEVTK